MRRWGAERGSVRGRLSGLVAMVRWALGLRGLVGVVVCVACLVGVGVAAGDVGDLTYVSCFGNPDAATGLGPSGCTPALGLGRAFAVAVSQDGASVYAVGAKSGGLAVLRRAANGDLAYAACFGNPDAATGIGPVGCTPALGLGGADAVAVSQDTWRAPQAAGWRCCGGLPMVIWPTPPVSATRTQPPA